MVELGPDPGHVFGEGEWQCVELAMRFMALVYGVRPYGANGKRSMWAVFFSSSR